MVEVVATDGDDLERACEGEGWVEDGRGQPRLFTVLEELSHEREGST